MSRAARTVRVMEARTLVPLPSNADGPPASTRVQVLGDRIVVDRLVLHDPSLAASLADRPANDRPALVERALRIGLIALQDAGVSVNVDVVRAEFERVLRQTEQVNERAAAALEETLRTNFADGDGRLPRTLERFLGNRYAVMASVGHVRDLPESAKEIPDSIKKKPWARMGVDVDADFTPYYVIPADKKPNVQKLKTALKDASEVLLATDPDREGESISWHLTEVLKPKIPVRRIEFHEITEEAVNDALKHARDINESLVRAQESRRIIDRLYGYSLSPVLWKKVQTGLSAGRVQSVAVRLIVEREEARRAFRTATYWDLEARLTGEGREFPATLVRIGEARVATGKDFDPATGALKTRGVRHLEEDAARRLAGLLERQLPWQVTSVDEKPGVERPAPPFTTSTLTQEASRKLGFSTARTMQIAQRLFQGIEVGNGEMEGLITYHRTDSTTLSDFADYVNRVG